MPSRTPRSPLRRLALVGAAFVVAMLSCGREVTSPGAAVVRYARGLSIQPVFPAIMAQVGGSAGLVPYDHVHLVFHHADGTVALDTVVTFAPGTGDLTLTLTVPLAPGAPDAGEPLAFTMDYVNAAGLTVFHGGPLTVLATPSVPGAPPPPPVTISVNYTGPGANAAHVVIAPRTATVFESDGFNFTAVAVDGAGTPLPGTPIVWTSLDPALATITAPGAGTGVALSVRGTAHIMAQLLTGPSDIVTVQVVLRAHTIAAQSGDGQSATVSTALGSPLVVRVTASDGVGVGGVPVTFAVATGGGSVGSVSVPTDASGLAQTTWTLAPTVGAQTVTASAAGLTGSPVTFTATGLAAVPTRLVVTTQPVSTTAGAALAAVVLTAKDAVNNTATAFTGPVTMAFGNNPSLATLGGTVTVNAVAGVATFSTLTVNRVGTGYTLVASSAGLTSATTAAFDIAAGALQHLEFGAYPVAGATAGVTIDPITTLVRDAAGNLVTTFSGAVTLAVGTGPALATLHGVTTTSAVAGVATFDAVSLTAAGSYTLVASATGMASANGPAFNLSAGPATALVLVSGGGQSAGGGATLPLPVVVQVMDAFGNAVLSAGRAVTFAVVTGSGSVAPTSATTTASGQASTTWTLGAVIGAQSITAASAGLATLTVGATSTSGIAGPATQLAFSVPPSTTVAGVSIAPAIVVQAKDASNLLATSFIGSVMLAFGANPGLDTLSGTKTVAAVAGVATFNNISLHHANAGYTLVASSGALTPATSAPFGINAGAATTMTISGGNGQSAVASTLLPTPIKVTITDALGNVVPGLTVNWAAVTGGGSVSAATSVTTPVGDAFISWTLGATPGAQTATATVTGLAGSPATFSATATVTGFSKTWTGATSTAWSTATNWTPAVVPVATDGVFIPLTANNPVLSASVTLVDLTVTPSASLSILANTVTLTGSLDAGTTIIGGGGSVLLTGTGNLKGVISAPVVISGTYTLNGATSITGTLDVTAGVLNISASTLTLTGAFSTSGTGLLRMQNAVGAMTVSGNATFNGGYELGNLTAGTLSLGSNFDAQLNAAGAAFAGSLNHKTRFIGAGVQTINMAAGGSSGFQNVDFAGPGSVLATSRLGIAGTAAVLATSGNIVGTGHGVNVAALTEPSGGAKWQFDTTRIIVANGGSFIAPATMTGLVAFQAGNGGTFDFGMLNGNLTADSVLFASASFRPNGHTVIVNGELRSANSGCLAMQNAADVVTVNGAATFAGSCPLPQNTQGTLTVKGNFSVPTTAFGFVSSATHTTVLAGGAAQTVSFAGPDTSLAVCSGNCFGNLTIAKSAGTVTFLTASNVQGALTISAGATGVSAIGALGSPKVVTVVGNTTTAAGTGVHFTRFYTKGNITFDASTAVDSIGFAGTAAQTIPAGTWGWMRVSGTPTLGGDITAANMRVAGGGNFTLGGHKVAISGYFATDTAGVLTMTNASDSLDVTGAISFGGTGASAPSAGKIVARGNVTATGATFQATGTNVLIVLDTNNVASSTLNVTAPVAGKGINTLVFVGPGSQPTIVLGDMNVMGDVALASNSPRVTSPVGTTVHISVSFADTTAFPDTLGGWQVANTEMTGTGTFSANFATTNLTVSGTTTLPPYSSSFVQVNGSVTVQSTSGLLDLNGNTLYVMTDFTTASGGRLRMLNGDYMLVSGNAFFRGGKTAGLLTSGEIDVLGDVTEGGGDAEALAPDAGFEMDVGVDQGCVSACLRASPLRADRSPAPRQLSRGRMPADASAARQQQLQALSQASAARLQQSAARFATRHAGRTARLAARARRLAALHIPGPGTPTVRTQRVASMRGVSRALRLANSVVPSTITFAHQGLGTGTSHFGSLYLAGSTTYLGSDVSMEDVLGTYYDAGEYDVLSSSATPRTLTSRGADAIDLVFDNVRWVLLDGAPVYGFDNTKFQNMDPTVDQFTVQRTGDPPSYTECSFSLCLYGWTFLTVPTTGHYIMAVDSDGPAPYVLTLNMSYPTPVLNGGHIATDGVAQINGWAASFDWTGAYSTNWDDPNNWSTGTVPTSSDDIFIPASVLVRPQLNSLSYAHNLTVDVGRQIDLACNNLLVSGNVVAPLVAEAVMTTCGEGEALFLEGDGALAGNTVVGYFNKVTVEGNYLVSGPGNQLIVTVGLTVQNSGNLTVNGGEVDVGGPTAAGPGMFATYGSGTLTMMNSVDKLYVGSGGAYFDGGSTTGKLTAGEIGIFNGFIHTDTAAVGDAFAPSGTHATNFAGIILPNTVEFWDPVNSYLNNVGIANGAGLVLFSDIIVKGTLVHGPGSAAVAIGTNGPNWLLTTSGLGLTGSAATTVSGVRIKFIDGTSSATFNDVAWVGFPAGFTGNVFEFARTVAGTYNFAAHNFASVIGTVLGIGGEYVMNSGTQSVTFTGVIGGLTTPFTLAPLGHNP